MARKGKYHEIDAPFGKGKCSVPMWMGGCPAGFCDEPAYGVRPDCETYRAAGTGEMCRTDGKYSGYMSGLACKGHGGPTLQEAIKGRTVIRFDGPPSHESGRFVEVERDGASISFGDWVQDGNDWLLVLPVDAEEQK